jgi:glutathione S-transferase
MLMKFSYRYLIEKYVKDGRLGGQDEAEKTTIRTSIHAAEGTFCVHALPHNLRRWFSPKSVSESGDLKKLEEGLAINVARISTG